MADQPPEEGRGYALGTDEILAGEVERVQTRATSLSPQDYFLLDQWGRQLREAFGETPYLVGSVARAARDPRDVDVRMLLPEGAEWLAPETGSGSRPLRLRTVNTAMTMWGRQVTGLLIDFQFQPADEFHEYDGDRRSALGTSIRHAVYEAQEAGA